MTGLAPNNLINPDLKGDFQTVDIGVDLGMLEDRIYLVADYYDKETDDLPLNVNVPRITGYRLGNQYREGKKLGWEFTVNTRNLVGGFKWSTDFNISFNRNQVRPGSGGRPPSCKVPDCVAHYANRSRWHFYGYIVEGVFNTQEEINAHPRGSHLTRPATINSSDVNGDGIINSQDRTAPATRIRISIYGLTNTFF